MTWFLFAIISAIAYAAAEIIGKYISDDTSEPVFIGFIAAVFTTFVMFQYASSEQLLLPNNILAFSGLIASAALVAIGIVTYYEGLKHSDVSEFGLLSRSRALLVVLGGVILFRERFTTLQMIGGVFVLYGMFLISWEGGKFHFGKGAKFALATSLFFGLGFLCDKAVIGFYTPKMYTFLNYLLIVAFLFPLALSRYIEGAKLPKRNTILLLGVIGFLYGVSAFCINSALSKGPVSLVIVASQLEIPITVLWGILVLNERKRLVPKLIAMSMLVVGIIFLR